MACKMMKDEAKDPPKTGNEQETEPMLKTAF